MTTTVSKPSPLAARRLAIKNAEAVALMRLGVTTAESAIGTAIVGAVRQAWEAGEAYAEDYEEAAQAAQAAVLAEAKAAIAAMLEAFDADQTFSVSGAPKEKAACVAAREVLAKMGGR